MSEKEYLRDENLIALSAEFHTHPRFHEYRGNLGDTGQGIMSIYQTVQDMGIMLTEWEKENPEAWADTHDWIAITEHFPHLYIVSSLMLGDDNEPIMSEVFRAALEMSRI